MKRLFLLVVAILTTVPAIAETRKYGPLMLDFGRAQKMGQSIVVPGTNPQKQPLFIAVLCEDRLFNFTSAESKWNDWNNPANIHEVKIIADVCNFIWDKPIHPYLPMRVRAWRSASSGRRRGRRRIALPNQAGALQLTSIPVIHCSLGSHDPQESHRQREEATPWMGGAANRRRKGPQWINGAYCIGDLI